MHGKHPYVPLLPGRFQSLISCRTQEFCPGVFWDRCSTEPLCSDPALQPDRFIFVFSLMNQLTAKERHPGVWLYCYNQEVFFYVLKNREHKMLKQHDVETHLSELWILRDIIVVSEHGHCLQVLLNVGHLFCFSPWIWTNKPRKSFI